MHERGAADSAFSNGASSAAARLCQSFAGNRGVSPIPDSHPSKPPGTKLRIGCVTVVVLLIGAGYYLHRVNQRIKNSYAVWWVADMVVEHMKANDNQWPRNWGDLRDDYETCIKHSGQPWSFAELSSRTQIDWRADPKELLARSVGDETARFTVGTLSHGTHSHWQGREPNQIILEYLRSNVAEQRP